MKTLTNIVAAGVIAASLLGPLSAIAQDADQMYDGVFGVGGQPGVTSIQPGSGASIEDRFGPFNQTPTDTITPTPAGGFETTGSAPANASTLGVPQSPALTEAQRYMNGTAPPQDSFGCTMSGFASDPGRGFAICISSLVYYVMVGLGSWVATISAYMFDHAIKIALNTQAYALDFITLGWTVVRDVANMAFIFVLIYIAFLIMFQAETTGTIKMLVGVLVVALMVNFSFFMTRVVIDVGNIGAVQFYNAIGGQQTPIGFNGSPISAANYADSSLAQGRLTSSIMNALGVTTLLNTNTFNEWSKNQHNSPMTVLITLSMIYIMVGLALFMVAAAFLFVSAKFIIRIVGLWAIIIAAPVAFVAAIFSKGKLSTGLFGMWLTYLISFAMYPAIFLFMFWIQTFFMQEMGIGSMFNSVFNSVNASTGANPETALTQIASIAASVGIRLAFIIASLYLCLKAADVLAHQVSSLSQGVEGKLRDAGLGALRMGGRGLGYVGARGSGLAYRGTVGNAADRANRQLTNNRFGNSKFGSILRRGAGTLANAKVGGAPSSVTVRTTREAREKERLDNLENIRNTEERRRPAGPRITQAPNPTPWGARTVSPPTPTPSTTPSVNTNPATTANDNQPNINHVESLLKQVAKQQTGKPETSEPQTKRFNMTDVNAGDIKLDDIRELLEKEGKRTNKNIHEMITDTMPGQGNPPLDESTPERLRSIENNVKDITSVHIDDLKGALASLKQNNLIERERIIVAPPQPEPPIRAQDFRFKGKAA